MLKLNLIAITEWITIVLIASIAFSCNDSKKIKTTKNKNQIVVGDKKTVAFYYDFPDTIHINKEYYGEIIYKSYFDTIVTSFENDINSPKSRYIIYSLVKTKNIDYNERYLTKIVTDTFGAYDCHTIPIYKIVFNELGTHYIDGIINDKVNINLGKKDKDGQFFTREITKSARATKKVIVIL